jgi:predicted esterase
VLAGGDGNGENLSEYWEEALRKALGDRYIIALPVAPHWGDRRPTPWLTRLDQASAPDTAFTTESFVIDIVRDVIARYPIDPARIYLHGVESGGIAAYACGLDTSTPFHGFYILSAPFRSALLPALTAAKGRRFVLQNSESDKTIPYWQVSAAAALLGKQGATVKLLPFTGERGYKFAGDAWQPIRQAIEWLQTDGRK